MMSKFKNLVDQLRKKRIEGITSVDAVVKVDVPVEKTPIVKEDKPKTIKTPRKRKGN